MNESSNIRRAVGENRGRRLWPEFRRALSEVLDYEVTDENRLTAEDTARVRTAFFERVRSQSAVMRLVRQAGDLTELLKMIANVREAMNGAEVVLLHENDRFTGAVRLPADVTLANPRRAWAVTREDFCVTVLDVRDGLCLEYNHLPTGDEYELHLWGRMRTAIETA